MSKSVTWHLAVWTLLLVFWLVATVFFQNANGPPFSNKYIYSLEPSTLISTDDVDRLEKVLSTTNNDFSDAEVWPSGQRMNMFKNELGCFGNYNKDIHTALGKREGLNTGIVLQDNLLNLQRMYNPSPSSVCTCVDKLYYASFWKEGELPTAIKTTLTAFLATPLLPWNSTASAERQQTKAWMLGVGAYHAQAGLASKPYDGLGFVSFMQTAQTMDFDTDGTTRLFTCTDEVKPGNSKMDVTQCVMRRDAAILSVCTRSAQGVQVIESRGIVNASYMKNFGVMCLFLYVFLTLFRHLNQDMTHEPEKMRWNHGWLKILSVALPAHLVGILYYAVNIFISIHHGDLSRSEPNRAGALSVLVVTVTVLGVADATYAVFGVFRTAWLARRVDVYTDHGHRTALQHVTSKNMQLKRDFLPLHPTTTTELVRTQACIDIQYIAGFTHLLLALVLEASVNEVQSLAAVVLMVLVAAFTQHMANILRSLQDMVLAKTAPKEGEQRVPGEQRVAAPVFRFLNECDACRVYLSFAFIVIAVYLVVSPRESQADPNMSEFVLAVLFFGAVSTGFDIIREVETKMTKTMWVSKHDVDKTRSYVMFLLIFMLTVQSAGARYKYYDK